MHHLCPSPLPTGHPFALPFHLCPQLWLGQLVSYLFVALHQPQPQIGRLKPPLQPPPSVVPPPSLVRSRDVLALQDGFDVLSNRRVSPDPFLVHSADQVGLAEQGGGLSAARLQGKGGRDEGGADLWVASKGKTTVAGR